MKEMERAAEAKPTRQQKIELKSRMRNMLMFLPNMVKLLANLLKDARVPTAEKALFLAAIVYVISPLDFIPDIFPFIGQVDDIYVVSLTLLRLVNRSDESVVRQHWRGGGDIVSLANSVAGLAPKFLPKRVIRVITSDVELAPAAAALNSLAKRDKPMIVEIPAAEKIDVETRSKFTN